MITKDPYGISGAIRPWDGTSLSSTSENRPRKGRKPTPEYFQEVRGCLSCTRPPEACNECAGPKEQRKFQARREIIQALKDGKSVAEIAKDRGVTRKTIQYYKKKYADQIEDPCVKCRSKAICKAMGGTCHAKARWDGGDIKATGASV